MMRYNFEVQAYQQVEVEASSAEEARMKIISREVDTILNCSSWSLGVDASVSDGEVAEQ